VSGIFKQAKRLGFYDGVNPAMDTEVNPHAAQPAETYAYSLEEIETIVRLLPEPAATAFATASFAGLRRGEIEGLEWTDYRNGFLWVNRSIWNGHSEEPKTEKSKAFVPVIRQLAERLDMYKLRCGNPALGPIFANSAGGRANMNNLRNRVILPALNRCLHCGLSQGKDHLKQNHRYERDPKYPEWHGFHSCSPWTGVEFVSPRSPRQSDPKDSQALERKRHSRLLR
jgi:hypothetical protein